MIKVLEEKSVPKAEVICSNCGSLLEYENADLREDFDSRNGTVAMMVWHLRPHCFTCPVCGCKVNASWILRSEMGSKEK